MLDRFMAETRRRSAPSHLRLVPKRDGDASSSAVRRILIVDDQDDQRDLYATYFEEAGFHVEHARDGEEALAKVVLSMPDLVVMDLAMPHRDGWETTRLIKSDPRTSNIVVIVLTATVARDKLCLARYAGADEVCTKPCLPATLHAIILEHLGQEGS
jgi:two-component system, cell cycle response regulator DivK